MNIQDVIQVAELYAWIDEYYYYFLITLFSAHKYTILYSQQGK